MRPKTYLQTLLLFTVLVLSGCASTQAPSSTRPTECVPEVFIKAVESCYGGQLCINRIIKQYVESCAKDAAMVQVDLEACGQEIDCMYNIIIGSDTDLISPPLPSASLPKPPPVESISKKPDSLPKNWSSVRELLTNLQKKLETSIPEKLRYSVEEKAQNIPVNGKASPAPFIMDVQRKGEWVDAKIIPTRRDWAYALYGAMYLNSAITSGHNAGFADISFWCFIKAALLADEAEHYANVAWFLNIMRRYEDAKLTLTLANELDSNHPDVYGELSFSLRRLGREDEANDALIKAINLERTANAKEAGIEALPKVRNPLPPNDGGAAYVEFNRGYALALGNFWTEYLQAMRTTLFSWTGDDPQPDPQWPIQVLNRRLIANEAALNQCLAGIREPFSPCPFGAGIYHPLCRNAPDRVSVKTSELRYDLEACECEVAYFERLVRYYHAAINDQIEMAKTFDRIWTPRLERFVLYWQGEIAYVNEAYSNPAYQWPAKEPYGILKDHYRFLKEFENTFLPFMKTYLERHKIELKAKARECTERAKKLAAFKEVAFTFKPLRCVEELGSHHKLDIGIFKWELFIGDKGTLGTQIDADFGAAAYSFTDGPDGSSHKITAKTNFFSADLHILPNGDWGTGGSVSVNILEPVVGKIVGKQLKKIAGKEISMKDAIKDGKKVGEEIGKFLKLDTKYEVTPNFKGGVQGKFVKPKLTFGYSERTTMPPGWIRFSKQTDRMHPIHFHGGPPSSGVGKAPPGWCRQSTAR
jgi:hypothetical protein